MSSVIVVPSLLDPNEQLIVKDNHVIGTIKLNSDKTCNMYLAMLGDRHPRISKHPNIDKDISEAKKFLALNI